MRRTLLPITAAVVLAAPLAACGGSDDDASSCTPVVDEFTVRAQDDLKFDAESYDADAGCIEVTYENTGSVAHTLLIKEQSGFKLSMGDMDTGTIDLADGTYVLYCDIPGHEAAGMEADLVVS